MPRISVLLPSYKPSRRYALECFAGLEAQTFRDFEVVIVDESDEETADFLRAQKTSFPVRVLRPATRLGLAKSLNYGLAHCEGEFIARHDIDDICEPTRFEAQVALLDAQPQVSAVGTAITKIGAHGEIIGVRRFPEETAAVRRASGFNNPFCHSAITLRRSFFDEHGVYREDLKTEDYELWFRALGRGAQMVNIPDALVRYRIESNDGHSLPRYWGEGFRLRLQYLALDNLPIRLVGLTLAGIAAITPPALFDHIYGLFNRLR